jgi:hypothetical protein
MPQFWIAIFFILLAVAQLYDSIKDINLPFPVYLVLGTLLAVASKSQAKFSLDHSQPPAKTDLPLAAPGLGAAQTKLLSPVTSKDRHELQASGLDQDLTIPDC